jgi:hypothetical protein
MERIDRKETLTWLANRIRRDGCRARANQRVGVVVVGTNADWAAVRHLYGYYAKRGMIVERERR